MDLKKKGEIFENHNGRLIFICCICNASNVGLLEVENHLKTHIEFVLPDLDLESGTYLPKQEIQVSDESDLENETWINVDTNRDVKIKWSNIQRDTNPELTNDSPAPGPTRYTSVSDNKSTKPPISKPTTVPKKWVDYSRPTYEQYKCDICNVICNKKDKLKAHIYSRHTVRQTHDCHICGHKFSERNNLTTHLNRHNKIKKFECNECGKKFVSSSERTAHIRAHRGERNFLCKICGKGFITSGHCTLHTRRVHTNDRKHVCDYIDCNKSYVESYHLAIHKRSHTGERPYTCDICKKDFANPKVLRNHKLLHSGDKRFQCKFCPIKFSQGSGRRGHERRVHGVV